MFQVAYLFVLALAALPLAVTLLQGRKSHRICPPPLSRRRLHSGSHSRNHLPRRALSISLEDLWFAELGQRYRFWLSIEYRVEIFLAILLLVGLFVGSNLRLLCRPLPIVPRSAPWIVGFAIAALIGF